MSLYAKWIPGFIKRWAKGSPSRELLLETAWTYKQLLFSILACGFAVAVLEGLTFSLLAIALELLSSPEPMAFNKMSKWGLGWLADFSPGRQFVGLIFLVVTCQIFKSIFQVLCSRLTTIISTQSALAVQQKVLSIVLTMSFGSASKYKIGELSNFVVQPAESVAQVLIQGLNWLTGLFTVGAYVLVLCGISFPLFLASLVLFGGVVFLQKFISKKIGQLSFDLGMRQADLNRKVVESVGALRLIHAFHRQELVKNQVAEMQHGFVRTLHELNHKIALLAPLAESLILVGLGAFLLVGYFLFKGNPGTILADLLTFTAVLNRLSGKISGLGMTWSSLRTYASRVSVLNDLLTTQGKEFLREGGAEVTQVKREIEFDHVTIRYPGRNENALSDVCLSIPIGQSLALVGPSGGGKSSLADLLLGLYRPTSGTIRVDGQSLDEINLESWRDLLGVVSQDTLLFNSSVRDNLLFAKPGATEGDLERALVSADAWSFVSGLPQGLETVIGERGFMLSGGQRQRLAIARALLRQPALLILDEATSALDTHAEQAVQETIDSLSTGRTRLIIAHRLSTIRNADKIAVIERGRVVETGSHDDLLARNGLYASLWRKQTGEEFIKEGPDTPNGFLRTPFIGNEEPSC